MTRIAVTEDDAVARSTERVVAAAREFVEIDRRCRDGSLRPWGRKYKQAVNNLAIAVIDYEERAS